MNKCHIARSRLICYNNTWAKRPRDPNQLAKLICDTLEDDIWRLAKKNSAPEGADTDDVEASSNLQQSEAGHQQKGGGNGLL